MEQCRTGNPIDDCWRCDPEWEANRRKLADCAVGFGKNAIGGRDGDVYVVTDSGNDDPLNPTPGTLRHAVIQTEPLWIIFDHDMVINLREQLLINSYKTIDGRGHDIQITSGPCITCRHGYFHIVNNVYTGWQMYAIGGSANPTINSQGNVFVASDSNYSKEVTKRESYFDEWKNWNWRSEGDMMLNGAFFTPSGEEASESYIKASSMVARPSSLLTKTAQFAGSLRCRKGYGC
ncbi:hypothetical protein PVK06_018400 [Gossypium arboreum]|uniref:Pectate lyase n=1 Tax=Gossypium arboreum TaxID=29729 RepID=A0ABR0Q6K8_GOSAR|nr:hypothetical protein PVK06_018400 [Gossypium arboreum]